MYPLRHSLLMTLRGRLVVILIILCGCTIVHAQWQYHAAHDFVVAYTQRDLQTANEAIRFLRAAAHRLRITLGDSLRDAVLVYVCPDRASFNVLSHHAAPDWGDGLADLTHRRILLLSPSATPYRRPLDQLVSHELIHILMHDLTRGRAMPTWLAEGAAIYYSGEVEHSDPVLISRALFTHSLITFDELDDVLRFEAVRASLAYQESYQAVRFLVHRHGTQAVRDLCAALAASPDPAAAFAQCFNEDLIDFETAYFDWLRDNYRWQFLLDTSMVVWGAVIILLLTAFFVVRRRTRRKMVEWEEEERRTEAGDLRPEAGGEKSSEAPNPEGQ